MFKISQDRVAKRWDLLPDNLKDTISDQLNSDFIWQTCEEQHIPEEKIYTFLKLSAYVLMGFIHYEDLSKELQDATGIDKRIVDDISNKINTRIFLIVKDSIDKIYTLSNSSLSKQEIPTPTNTNGPVILSDIKDANNEKIPSPVMSIPSITTIKKDFETKTEIKKDTVQKDNSASKNNIPMPVILQNDSSFATVNQNSNFHVDISEDKMKEISKNQQTTPIKAAKIEFGAINKNDQNSSVINLNNKDTTTNFDKNSINLNNNVKNRVFTEITSDVPKPKEVQFNDIKIAPQNIPSPTQNNVNNILNKPIPQIIQKQTIPQIEKPTVSAEKVQAFFNPIVKSQDSPVKKEAVVIQKDYSEADIVNKPKVNTIDPASKVTVPTPTPPIVIKELSKNAPVPPFIIK